jgi:hypothetical protein
MTAGFSFAAACSGLGVVNGALVALPAPAALGRLERVRSAAWMLAFPAILVVGTFGVLALPPMATGLAVLASVVTPLLAAVAMVAVVHGRQRRLLLVPAALVVAATLTGEPGQIAAGVLTAAGCLTLGTALVRVTPAPWLTFGVLSMCAVDVLLMAWGVGQHADDLLYNAGSVLPTLHHVRLGPITTDYPDLVLAAVVGGILAGRAGQRRAAVVVATLSGAYTGLLSTTHALPATVPLALALILVELGPRLARLANRARTAPRWSGEPVLSGLPAES